MLTKLIHHEHLWLQMMLLTISPDDLIIITLCSVDSMIEELVKGPSRVEIIDISVDKKLIARRILLGFAPRASSLDSFSHAQAPVMGFVVEKWHL